MELKRDSAGLGLSIVGGSDTPLVRRANKDATAKIISSFTLWFSFYQTQVWSLSCLVSHSLVHSLHKCFANQVGLCTRLVKVATWICQQCSMDLKFGLDFEAVASAVDELDWLCLSIPEPLAMFLTVIQLKSDTFWPKHDLALFSQLKKLLVWGINEVGDLASSGKSVGWFKERENEKEGTVRRMRTTFQWYSEL